jgi:hypothetical protein
MFTIGTDLVVRSTYESPSIFLSSLWKKSSASLFIEKVVLS